MKKFIDKTKRFFIDSKLYKLYFILIIAIFIYIVSLYYLNLLISDIDKPFENAVSSVDELPLLGKAFVVIIFGPLMETFFFQFLIIEGALLVPFFNRNPLISICISSILFAATHNQSNYFLIYAFGIGLIFGFFYYILKLRKDNAFINTALLHGIINFIILLVSYL